MTAMRSLVVRSMQAVLLVLFGMAGALAQALAPDIAVTKVVNAPVAEVWRAWTTPEGLEGFWVPKAARVEPVAGGAYELWFAPNAPEGSRGSEGCRVHSVRPMEQFVFEWSAPPTIPGIRTLRTLVYVDFRPLDPGRTEVTLRNFGYGDGEDWAKTRAYFDRAWNNVMTALVKKYGGS